MKYIEDREHSFEQQISKYLREHNSKFVSEFYYVQEFYYALNNDELVGAAHTTFCWDWVSIGNLFYKDSGVLSSLLSKICSQYKNKAVGIKYFTKDPGEKKDLTGIGFIVGGHTSKTPLVPEYTFLKSNIRSFEPSNELTVISSDKEIGIHEKRLSEHMKSWGKDDEHDDPTKTKVTFVALDNDEFAGGVQAIAEDDSMYVSRLSVVPEYRMHNIGSKLMQLVEERAVQMKLYNITLGTCSFQALPFYKKLGYKILFTKENDPKGHKTYSMEKKL